MSLPAALGFHLAASETWRERVDLGGDARVVVGPFPASRVSLEVLAGGPITLTLATRHGVDSFVVSGSFSASALEPAFVGMQIEGAGAVDLAMS